MLFFSSFFFGIKWFNKRRIFGRYIIWKCVGRISVPFSQIFATICLKIARIQPIFQTRDGEFFAVVRRNFAIRFIEINAYLYTVKNVWNFGKTNMNSHNLDDMYNVHST